MKNNDWWKKCKQQIHSRKWSKQSARLAENIVGYFNEEFFYLNRKCLKTLPVLPPCKPYQFRLPVLWNKKAKTACSGSKKKAMNNKWLEWSIIL